MRIQFAGNGNVRDAGVEADTEAGEAEVEVEAVDAAQDEAAFSERTFQVCSTRGRLPIPNCRHSLSPHPLTHARVISSFLPLSLSSLSHAAICGDRSGVWNRE